MMVGIGAIKIKKHITSALLLEILRDLIKTLLLLFITLQLLSSTMLKLKLNMGIIQLKVSMFIIESLAVIKMFLLFVIKFMMIAI
jgi:hypothetical protein